MGSANNSHRQLTLLCYDPITFLSKIALRGAGSLIRSVDP